MNVLLIDCLIYYVIIKQPKYITDQVDSYFNMWLQIHIVIKLTRIYYSHIFFHYFWFLCVQVFIILSCLIAVSVNFSTFLVIGKTSPVTYQVLGHLKTCLVLGFGYTLLHDPFTERNIIGILVAIFGMGLYSYFCAQENKKKQAGGDLSLGSPTKGKDGTPLLSQDNDTHEVKKSTKNSLV